MTPPKKLGDIYPEPRREPYVTVKESQFDMTKLCCPVSTCGHDYAHIHDAMGFDNNGHFDLTLSIEGECGHAWNLQVYQHKGQTFVEARNIREVTYGTQPEVNVDLNKVETSFWEAWCAHPSASHLWPLEPQVEYSTPGGNYRIDFGDPTVKYGIEIDGKAYHDGQEAFSRDRRRQNDLELEGWRFIRFAAIDVMNDVDDCVKRAITFFSNLDGGKP